MAGPPRDGVMGENGGPGLVAVGFFVVLLVAGVVRGVVGGEDPEAGPAAPAETMSTRGQASLSPTSSTTSTVGEGNEEGPAPALEPADAGVDVAPGPVAPVGPGLPPELAEQAQAVAAEVLVADVSGEGRERFSGYWGEELYRPCCREVEVHTSVARAVEGRDGMVVVSLVWSAERIDAGPPREQVETDVYLTERDGTWVPARPAEGGA